MKRFLVLLLSSLSLALGELEDFIQQTTLHGGQKFPLVGLGVGNLHHDLIETKVADGMDMGVRMVDTAHASHNEHIIGAGIEEGRTNVPEAEMHVITKVWYTHLGYERTKIAVRESLEDIKDPNIKVHMLIHWPFCRDDVPWMHCEDEEERLPEEVKKAGPAPHLDKDNAFKESWRALEDIYEGKVTLGEGLPKLESIGVSNFDIDELKALAKSSRITPHILQDNVWTYLFHPELVAYCKENNIHYQAYNVMNGILKREQVAPIAFGSLESVAHELSEGEEEGDFFTAGQVILRWLIQKGVSVIPRTTSTEHLHQNSPRGLGYIPDLEEHELALVEAAVKALLEGYDLEPARATFVNKHKSALDLFWWNPNGEEVPVKSNLAPGESFETQTYPGHVFVAYDSSKSQSREFNIEATYGEVVQFHIDEL